MNGEKDSAMADRITSFLERIDEYLLNSRLAFPDVFRPEFTDPEGFSTSCLEKLTQEECFNNAFMMLNYADHINKEKSKQVSIIKYCDWALNSIIAAELPNMPEFTKHDIKVAMITRENHVAHKLSEWKIEVEGRYESLTTREQLVRRKADILLEKGKRK